MFLLLMLGLKVFLSDFHNLALRKSFLTYLIRHKQNTHFRAFHFFSFINILVPSSYEQFLKNQLLTVSFYS